MDCVDQGRAGFRNDMNLVAVSVLPISVAKTQFTRAEKMQMNVPGNAMLRVFEMVVLAVGQRMAHVLLAGQEFAAVVNCLSVTNDLTTEFQLLEIEVGH